jgi:hypothetical protein
MNHPDAPIEPDLQAAVRDMVVNYAGVDRRRAPDADAAAVAAALVKIGDRSLAGEVGAEVAGSLSAALDQLDEILRTGKVGRAGLSSVRDEVERARRVAILGQQVSRLAAGVVRQDPEAVEVPEVLRSVLCQRRAELSLRGIEVRQHLRPASMSADASLVFTLLQCLMHWALQHSSGGTLKLSTALNTWPVHAVLQCEFAWAPPERAGDWSPLDDGGTSGLETVAWRLVEQSAAVLGVQLQREESGNDVHVTLAFPESARRWPKLVDANTDLDDAQIDDPLPLAGQSVLLLTGRKELQRVAQAALPALGLQLQLVRSVDEARSYERAPAPLIVADAQIEGLDALCVDWGVGAIGGPAIIRVGDAAPGVHIDSGPGGESIRIGQTTALRDLPAAVRYALACG